VGAANTTPRYAKVPTVDQGDGMEMSSQKV
jgi:hypothetical protein